jgi:hypothetical protein
MSTLGQRSAQAEASAEPAIVRGVRFVEGQFNAGYTCGVSPTLAFESAALAPREVFSAILVLELLGPALLSARWLAEMCRYLRAHWQGTRCVHFFEEKERLPADLDCTALALAALARATALSARELHDTLDTMLGNTDAANIVQVYDDPTGERAGILDPAVAANVLYAVNLGQRTEDVAQTEQFVFETLRQRLYVAGTRYYHCPDTFLLFVARLVSAFPRYQNWRAALSEALEERQRVQNTTLGFAQWSSAASLLQLWPTVVEHCRARIRNAQREDGSWPAEALFTYGRKRLYFGSEVLTSTFALHALSRTAHENPSYMVKNSTRRFMSSGFWNTSSISAQGGIEEDLVPLINTTRRSDVKRLRQAGIKPVDGG